MATITLSNPSDTFDYNDIRIGTERRSRTALVGGADKTTPKQAATGLDGRGIRNPGAP